MENSIEKLVNDILHLPHEMRAYLAEKLLESLDTDSDFKLSKEWHNEILKRCKDIDEGNVQLVDAEEAFKRAYSQLS